MALYTLGPVKPWVRKCAYDIGPACNVRTIGGWGTRSNPTDHDDGLALDFMVYSDKAKGDNVASMVIQKAKIYGVTYLIWQQRINSLDGHGWERMEDRGSPTANHMDHVHVSFSADGTFSGKATGAGGVTGAGLDNPFDPDTYTQGFQDLAQGFEDIGNAISILGDSHTWLRLGMILGGVVLLLVALFSWDSVKGAVQNAVSKTGQKGSHVVTNATIRG